MAVFNQGGIAVFNRGCMPRSSQGRKAAVIRGRQGGHRAWLQRGQPGQQAESQHAARTEGEATAATGMRKQIARLMVRMIFMPRIGAAAASVTAADWWFAAAAGTLARHGAS